MSNQVEDYEYYIKQQEIKFERERTRSAIAHGMQFIGSKIAAYLDDPAYRIIMRSLPDDIEQYLLNCGYLTKSEINENTKEKN